MTAALEEGEWSAARPDRTLPPGKTRYSFSRRVGGPQVRSGRAEILAPTGIRSPNRPARRQSLYRLSYRAHNVNIVDLLNYEFRRNLSPPHAQSCTSTDTCSRGLHSFLQRSWPSVKHLFLFSCLLDPLLRNFGLELTLYRFPFVHATEVLPTQSGCSYE